MNFILSRLNLLNAFGVLDAKLAAEKAIADSGLPDTIIDIIL
jgi:hypothetical protein